MEYNKNAVDRVEFLCYFGEVKWNHYYGVVIVVGRLGIVSRRRWNENRDEQKQSLFLHGIKSTEFATSQPLCHITMSMSSYPASYFELVSCLDIASLGIFAFDFVLSLAFSCAIF